MAYGKIKADTLVYDNSGTDVEKTIASLASAASTASPTFTGTPAAPTAAANTNTTQIATTAYVQTELGDYAPLASPTFTGTINGAALTLSGNLTVNGTTTTIDSTTLTVEDKNIELGKVDTPSDTTADGGGITLKGATDKTITWSDASDTWNFNQGIVINGDATFTGTGTSTDNAIDILYNHSNGVGQINVDSNGGSTSLKFGTSNSGSLTTALTINSSQNATFAGTVSDSKGNVRSIPAKDQGGASEYTLIASDAGKTILRYGGGLTIPNSVMTTGDAVTIINASGSDITLTQGSGFTLYNTADASTGNRTLAGRGMATIWFPGSSSGYISGAGLS